MKREDFTIPVEVYDADDPFLPSLDKELIEYAKEVSINSYAPYSKFHVGAALRLANDKIVTGSNQENAVYPVTCCAERTALYAAGAQYPDTPIEAIAIAIWRELDQAFMKTPASPCGMCRQHLVETEMRYQHNIRVILFGTSKTIVLKSAKDLLPLTFTGTELSDV